MKKLINAAEHVVRDALVGMELAHPDLIHVEYDPTFVVRAAAPVGEKVALVSGGGSGHEPLHAGFVGYGMLDAACPGEIFTSPVPDQIVAATRAVDGGAGVLYIVKNYSGDVMNFELATELACAEGMHVTTALVSDDVAVEERGDTTGRRGVGTTVLLEKIVGAAAEAHAGLATCKHLAYKVNAWGRSMGMALTSCTVPAHGKPTFDLGPNEIEVGVGIHGEPGRSRQPLQPASTVVELLAAPIVHDLALQRGDRVLAFVNGMGGTPLLELYIVYQELVRFCNAHGISIARNLVGNYITALEMAGCSITLLKLDDELIRLWDAPVHTPALRRGM